MKASFITSTGRTGTGFFVHLFNNHVKNSWSLHEPKPAFRSRAGRLIKEGVKPFDVTYFKIPRLFRGMTAEKEVYVECNYHLASAMDVVRGAFPESQIIHIIRDGRDIVTSWLNRNRYIDNDHITPFETGDLDAQKKWDKWTPLQKLAWHWCVINRNAEKSNPDLFIKFEDIFSDDNSHLLKVLDTIGGLDYDKDEVTKALSTKQNYTKKAFFPEYDEWPDYWKKQFWEIAGDTMKHFGYPEA